MSLYSKILELIDPETRSLVNDLYDMRTLDEWIERGVVIDFEATCSSDENSIAIGHLATVIPDDKFLEPLDIKLSPLPDLDNDESYRAWLELITESNGVPSELVTTPPKQGVTYR